MAQIDDEFEAAADAVDDGLDDVSGAVDDAADAVGDTVSGLAGKANDAVPDSSESTAATVGANPDTGTDRVRRMLWWGLGIIAALVLLALLAAQCGGDDDSTAAGDQEVSAPTTSDETATEDDEATTDSAAAGGDDSDDAADDGDTDGDTDDAANGGADTTAAAAALQDRVDEILSGTGIAGLAGLVDADGTSVTLTGEVGSEDDRAAVETALAELDLTIDNQLTVAGAPTDTGSGDTAADDDFDETPAAEATESDPTQRNGRMDPGRPGGLTRNPYRIEVDVDDFTLTVFRNDNVHFRTVVGIGEGDTPTPYGSFYLTDLLRPSDPTGIYGPYAYGLSGFSESLTSFNGGAGVIGIHGTNEPSALGTRVNHGCIRVANMSISEMATFLPLGTPVEIDDEPGRARRKHPEAVPDG